MVSHPESNINFLARLGALLSGAEAGWMARGIAAFDMQAIEQQDRHDDFERRTRRSRGMPPVAGRRMCPCYLTPLYESSEWKNRFSNFGVKSMPSYDYRCAVNGRVVEVRHRMSEKLTTWGEVCEKAGIDAGDTARDTPVERLITGGSVVSSTALSNPEPPCASGGCSGGLCGLG